MAVNRIPRKIKKQIPNGPYCYTILDIEETGKQRIKPCPFYKHIKGVNGYCILIKNYIPDMLKFCPHKWKSKYWNT